MRKVLAGIGCALVFVATVAVYVLIAVVVMAAAFRLF